MKRVILCFTALLLLLFATCEKDCIKRPKNVEPIDWENYNDVYTVYWNTIHLCSETINLPSDTIKIVGWRAWSYDAFNLCDDAKYADKNLGYTAAFPCITIECNLPEFKTKLDTCDLTKKCFIKGKLSFFYVETSGKCCKIGCRIEITNINDIYFE